MGTTPSFQPKVLLNNFNGFARPGEMVLVLGRPGSGCSTFLKVIANERGTYSAVTGDVEYGGIKSSEIEEMYKGQVMYNQEDDVHHATLTVAQTIMFGLRSKVALFCLLIFITSSLIITCSRRLQQTFCLLKLVTTSNSQSSISC